MSTLVAVGDSFTYGDELHDRETQAYPYLLQKQYNFNELINLGLPGGSSDYVFRTVIELLISGTKPDLIIISWPEQNRFEGLINHPKFESTDDAPHIKPTNFMIGRKTITSEPNWVQGYYRESYDIAWAFRKQYNQIIALQGFLKNVKQRYLMCNVNGLRGYYDRYEVFLKNHFASIDPAFFVGWPREGFVEWTKGCIKGKFGHPLVDGHQIIAEKFNEHIRNIGWFS